MKDSIKILLILIVTATSLSGFSLMQKAPTQDSIDLPTIMRLIASNMDLIDEGIYTQNYSLIAEGAAAINAHPPLSDETKLLIKETLGERMETFGRYDEIVHGTADSLRIAAQNQDMKQILEDYQIIQQGCVKCHAAFQDEIQEARLAQSE